MTARSRFWSFTAELMSLDQLEPAEMRALHDYWKSKAGGDVPSQRDLHVPEMPDCVGNIALVTVRSNPLRARYRLVGYNLVKLLGFNPNGRYLHEVYGSKLAAEIYESFERAIADRRPAYFRREFQILGRSFGYNRLVLPLRFGSERIDRLLICIFPTSRKLKDASQWRPVVEELHKLEEVDRQFSTSWAQTLEDDPITNDNRN